MKESKGHILSKAPCNADLFEGQAHDRLAEAIAEEIRHDSNCTIIGIDGGWGSGKSNLVGLVEKKLTANSEETGCYHFFTYDAWGHQNDLPRRSILEELTSDLVSGEHSILSDKKWKEKKDNLLAKKKKTSTKIIPRLNFAILTIALLVAMTPVIASINSIIPKPLWRLVFSGVLYLGSILFVVFRQKKSMKDNNQTISFQSFISELFLLYKDRITENELYETISEREPSTRQFKDWMAEMDHDLNEANKMLVLVIDNMDRLPKLKVQELWAAIHSFFSEITYTNIRVIVPFDRSHIRNAFQSENIIIKDEDIAVYGDDFINKTFHIVYHVAPPILSGWKSYFDLQWKQAFGLDSSVDNTVLQIYDLKTKEQTPRKIVAFIDEFVTIKSVADPAIPNKYIALFIFGRQTITKDPIKEILTPSYLEPLGFLYKDDKNMPMYISSLYYQLPVEDAVDVVYVRQFTRELDENVIDSIQIMKEKSMTKFNAILSRSLSEVTNTNNASLALQSLFGDEIDQTIQSHWDCLYNKEKSLGTEIKQYQPYHKALLSHITEKMEYWKSLIKGYHDSISDSTIISDYVKGIDNLSSVKEISVYAFLSRLKKKISGKQFVSLVTETEDRYRDYGLFCDNTELSNYLSSLDISALNTLTIIPYLDHKEYPLDSFRESIESHLSSVGNDAQNAEILFNRLKDIKEETINYKDYFNSNTLEQLYSSASESFKPDLIAMRISSFESYSSSWNYIDNDLNTADDVMLEKVANIMGHYCDYGTMLISLRRYNNPFMKKLCKFLTVDYEGTQAMSIELVARNFEIIIENSEITPKELLTKMNEWRDYMDEIKVEQVPSLPLSIFEAARLSNSELSEYLLNLADKYMSALSQDDWEKILPRDGHFALKLLRIYHPHKMQPFFDAFKKLMKGYARGEMKQAIPVDNVDVIIEISKELKHGVVHLFTDIRDYFMSTTITAEKLKYFGNWIFEYGNLDKKSGCLVGILPSEIIDDNSIIGLLLKNKDVVKSMVEHTSDPSEFKEKLLSMLTGSRKDDDRVNSLCSYLDIRVDGIEVISE